MSTCLGSLQSVQPQTKKCCLATNLCVAIPVALGAAPSINRCMSHACPETWQQGTGLVRRAVSCCTELFSLTGPGSSSAQRARDVRQLSTLRMIGAELVAVCSHALLMRQLCVPRNASLPELMMWRSHGPPCCSAQQPPEFYISSP
jgi:hypothetical protein